MMEEKEFNRIFAKNLRDYLDEFGMAQVDLAKRLNVGPTTIYNWLNAIKSPRIDKVDEICKIFGCTRADLIDDNKARRLDEADLDLLRKYHGLNERDRGYIDGQIDLLLEKKTNRMEGDVNVG